MRAVSVIIPFYNVERYLSRALDMVCGQSLKNIEIILVDDGSSDSSIEIIKKRQETDDRIILLQQERRNAGVARNTGMAAAKGKYLVFWDCDDCFAPEALELMYKRLEETAADICLCGSKEFDVSRNEELANSNYLYADRLPEKEVFNKHDLQNEIFNVAVNVPWNKMLRRSFVEEKGIRFQDIIKHNDTAFSVQAMFEAERICYVTEQLITYNVNSSTSISDVFSIITAYDSLAYSWELLKDRKDFGLVKINLQNRLVSDCCYSLMNANSYEEYSALAEKLLSEGIEKFDLNRLPKNCYIFPWMYEELRRLQKSGIKKCYEKKREPKGAETEQDLHLSIGDRLKLLLQRNKMSIIIPVYNVEKYIHQCLDSVLAQTYRNLEIVCVDDGSRDNCGAILDEYSKRDKRIKVIHQENKGLSGARNVGLEASTGEYVYFLDSDDFVEKDLVEKVLYRAKRADADVVIFMADRFDEADKQFKEFGVTLDKGRLPKRKIFSGCSYPDNFFIFTIPAVWNKAYRREFLKKYEELSFPHDIKVGEDTAFTYTSMALADRVSCLRDKPYLHYRINVGSNITSNKDRIPLEGIRGYYLLQSNLKKYNLYRLFKRSYVTRAALGIDYETASLKSEEARRIADEFMDKHALNELEVRGHGKEYFMDASVYERLEERFEL